jgi:hypothetical protein
MKADVPAVERPPQSARSRNKFTLVFLGFLFGLLFVALKRFLPGYEGPWSARLGLALAPWLLVGGLVCFGRRLYREDELEMLINRRALVFAFYAGFFGLVALELLQAAGFVPRFAWTNERLLVAMSALMFTGMAWSGRRYT